MKKSIIGAVLCVAALVILVQAPSANADCGKMPIVYHQWVIPVPPPPQPVVIVEPAVKPPRKSASKNLIGEKNNDVKNKQIQKAGRDVINATVNGNDNNVTINVYPGKDSVCKPDEKFVPLPSYEPAVVDASSSQEAGTGFAQGSIVNVGHDWVTTLNQENLEKTTDFYNQGLIQDSGIKDVVDVAANSIDESNVGTVAYGDDAFAEPEQQGLIAWNGSEETLILSTNEENLMGASGSMLSVLPLPGAPISIERANLDAFVTAKACVQKKIAEKKNAGEVQEYGVVYDTKIGSHNIFVWKIESGEDFAKGVQGYVASKYDSKAAALITPNTLKTVQWYCDKGYKYFAFDLTLVEAGQTATKEAIAYNFKAPNVYFPLVISKVGGAKTATTVDLIVFSKGSLNLAMEKSVQEQVNVLGGKDGTVVFSNEELKQIDENVAARFAGEAEVKGREFIIRGTLDQFDDDFLAVSAQ